jgi:hypothetical protein
VARLDGHHTPFAKQYQRHGQAGQPNPHKNKNQCGQQNNQSYVYGVRKTGGGLYFIE